MVPIKVTSIKLKPLLSPGAARLDSRKVLESLQRQVLRSLRGKILQETFSSRAKKALTQGIKVKIGPKSITLIATHPAFFPLLQGQKSGQMSYLVKARAPIPIVTDDGKLIFRSATAKSMKDGKWIHPGHKPTTVIEKAREEAREIIKAKVKKDLKKQLMQSLRGR